MDKKEAVKIIGISVLAGIVAGIISVLFFGVYATTTSGNFSLIYIIMSLYPAYLVVKAFPHLTNAVRTRQKDAFIAMGVYILAIIINILLSSAVCCGIVWAVVVIDLIL